MKCNMLQTYKHLVRLPVLSHTLMHSCIITILLLPSLQQQNMRENKEKQALGDLMIKPVQRIPRYELLVKVNYLNINSWFLYTAVILIACLVTMSSCRLCVVCSRICLSTHQRITQTILFYWTPSETSNDWLRGSIRAVAQLRRRRGRPGSFRRLRHT